MSYANVIMYSVVLPSYSSKRKGKGERADQKVLKADDRTNREEVIKFIETCH